MNVVVSCAGQRRWSASYDGPRAMQIRYIISFFLYIFTKNIILCYVIIKRGRIDCRKH